MKKFFYISTLLLAIGSSCQKKAVSSYPETSHIVGLATPIVLNPDETVVHIRDYFPLEPKIDSISSNKHLKAELKGETLKLKVISDELPKLSILKFKIEDTEYSILVKKSNKIKYKFVFTSKKKYKKVQLMGEFNAWNPNNANLKYNGSDWEFSAYIEPGEYQYLVVLDGEQQLDPNNPVKVSNNMGGFNSLIKVGNYANLNVPELYTESNQDKSIKIGYRKNVEKIIVCYDNYLIPEKDIVQKDQQLELSIPADAINRERSFIRVWAFNTDGVSNDLLIPLHKGSVLKNVANLNRTDYEASVLYNVFIDRFFDGNPDNTKPVEDKTIHPRANYHGGDIKGISEKITEGYFKNLGVNTIWISPIVKNPKEAYGLYPEPKTTFSAYHGYWPISFTEIDERFGTENELHELVKLAHDNDMNVLLDFVANHVHEEHPIYIEHPDWATKLHLEDGSLNTERWDSHRLTTWFDVFLPTLDLSKPEVYEMLSDSAVFWIKKYDLDGFRHDATKHVPEIFWRTLTYKLKKEISIPQNKRLYQIGETYGTPELISSYVNTGQLNAQFDFNVYDAIITTLANGRSFKDLESELASSQKYYGSHHLMGNITGNQDRARFISYAAGDLSFDEDTKKAGWTRNIGVKDNVGYKKSAMVNALVATLPGLPVIFYGDEIGMSGGNDPDNRKMMRFNDLKPEEKELKEITKKLLHFRTNSLSLIYGDMKIIESNDDVLIYQRSYFDKVVIIALNKSKETKTLKFHLEKRFKSSELAANFGSKMTVVKDNIELRVPANSFEIIAN